MYIQALLLSFYATIINIITKDYYYYVDITITLTAFLPGQTNTVVSPLCTWNNSVIARKTI